MSSASVPVLPLRADVPRRRWAAAMLWLVVGVNGGVIVWLWLHGGGISQVSDNAALFTSLGRITALIGTYQALLQLLLLARLPWLEQLVGFDRLTVWHRLNGKVCLIMLLAHAFLITLGYSLSDKISLWHEFKELWNGYPHIVTATVGTAMMVLVVVTSLVIVRRRLPYEGWYFVHVSVYLAIVLAYLHQIPTGNEFTANTGQADYWIALYVVTAAVLVVFRVLAPLRRMGLHGLRVCSVEPEGHGVVSIHIHGRDIEGLRVQAGQFFIWRFLSKGRWWQSHPFSISALPQDEDLRITVKAVGSYSAGLARLKPGTRVLAEGPFGTFTQAARTCERAVLIAGGIGITPARALAQEMAPGSATLIYRVLREEDIVLRAELEALDVSVHYVIGDHLQGDDLLSAERLLALVPEIGEQDVYVCGPPAMTAAIEASLKETSVPRRQIHIERFAL